MLNCESLDLIILQGKYLRFIVENFDELNTLEHFEECKECQKEIFKILKNGEPSFTFGNLFNGNFLSDSLLINSDIKKQSKLINERIKCRKELIAQIIQNAEIELREIESRLDT
jgi:hypothetical protein